MATHSITQERLKSLLTYDPDTGEFCWRADCGARAKAGSAAGSRNSEGYVQIQIGGKKHKAHRLAWLLTYGETPPEIDHINRVKHDNRLANLRPATHAENGQNQNRPKNNTSGAIGVGFHKRSGKWRARITRSGKLRDIGYFDTKEAATAARKAAEAAFLPFRSSYADD